MDLSEDAQQGWQDDEEDLEDSSSLEESEPSEEEEYDWGVADMLALFRQKHPSFSRHDDGAAWNAPAIAPCYTSFVDRLSEETDTTAYKSIVLDCLDGVIQLAYNEALVVGFAFDTPSEPVTAMIVYVWLMISYVRSTHRLPRENSLPITILRGSYFHSVYSILEESPIFSDLEGAVVFWEDRVAPTLISPDDFNTQEPNWLSAHLENLRSLASAAPPLPPRNEKAKEWLDILREGGVIYLANVTVANVQTSVMLEVIKDKEDRNTMFQRTWQLLAAMDRTLLESIIFGRVCQDNVRIGSPVRIALDRTSWDQPGIYMNMLADTAGVAPTPSQWRAVCKGMDQYVYKYNDRYDKMASVIDQMVGPREAQPHPSCRSYMNDTLRRPRDDGFVVNTDPIQLDVGRRSVVKEFLSNMRRRLKEEGQGKHCPMHHAVCEIGWATNPAKRLRQHRDHENSNYLMNLAESIFQYLYPDAFQLHQVVLVNCWAPEHCWIGEIFLTEFAQGYIDGGYGFSHHPAGDLNHQALTTLLLRDWNHCIERALSDRYVKSVEESRQEYNAYGERFEKEEAIDQLWFNFYEAAKALTDAVEMFAAERRNGLPSTS